MNTLGSVAGHHAGTGRARWNCLPRTLISHPWCKLKAPALWTGWKVFSRQSPAPGKQDRTFFHGRWIHTIKRGGETHRLNHIRALMADLGDLTPAGLRLYRLRGVKIPLPDGRQLGPIDWDMEKARRVAVSCADPEHWDALMDFLTGLLPPISGDVAEKEPLIVQTDRNLLEKMNLNRPFSDFLNAPETPKTLWLDHRVRSTGILLERLGLSPKNIRRDVILESETVRDKFWALRFMLSQADLLMGRDVFQIGDPLVRDCLRMWWGGFQGVLIGCENGGALPGAVDTRFRTCKDGGVTIASAPTGP